MFEKDEIEKVLDWAESIFGGGKSIVLTIIGEVAYFGVIPEAEGKTIPDPVDTIYEKSFRRIIKIRDISAMWEHEKGTVVSLMGENLIVPETLEFMAALADIDLK